MKLKFHKITAFILILAMMVPLFVACGDSEEKNLEDVYKLSETFLNLKVGEMSALLIFDEEYSDRSYTAAWSSDNYAVVDVSSDTGYIEAVGAGTAIVSVLLTFENDQTVTLSCTVNVTQDTVNVTGLSLSAVDLTMDVDGVSVITATVLPSDATNKIVNWTTSDASVAVVTSGVITALSAGTAVISATTEDGQHSATCYVTVNEAVDVFNSITFNKTSVSVAVGNTTSIVATVKPEGVAANIIWTSGDDSIATVENGTITGIKAGSTTITATLNDKVTNKVATCKVTVSNPSSSGNNSSNNNSNDNNSSNNNSSNNNNNNQSGSNTQTTIKATKVELDVTQMILYEGETGPWKFIPTVTPSNTTQTGTWTSNNPSVAQVDSNGNITIGSIGSKAFDTATITYTVGSVSKSGVVVVMSASENPANPQPSTPEEPEEPEEPIDNTPKVTDIILGDDTLDLIVNEKYPLGFDAYPKSASDTYNWKSSNESVATVSTSGVVTAVSVGTANITVTGEKSGVSATCIVTVINKPAESIELDIDAYSLSIGSTRQINATITPSDANDPITWTSSSPTIVSVDQTGLVTALGNGTVTITAKTASGKTAECTILAGITGGNTGNPANQTQVKVSVYISATGDLKAGSVYNAYLTFSPSLTSAQLADCMFVINTTNSSIAEVVRTNATDFSKNAFTVIPGEDGTASLSGFVSYKDQSIVFTYEPKTVVVNSPSDSITTPITSVSLSSSSRTMYVGDTATLIASVNPVNNNDRVSWSSSNESVVKIISNDLVATLTAVGTGTATITCKSKGNLTTNNRSASCTITVSSTGSVNNTQYIIAVSQGSSYTPTLSEFGVSGTLIGISPIATSTGMYIANNTTIVVADEVSMGSTMQVYVNYINAAGQYTSSPYTVMVLNSKPSTSSTVSEVSLSADIGDSGDLSQQYSFSGATYTSNNPQILSIDQNTGLWTAHVSGTATVSIKDSSGNELLRVKFTIDYETVAQTVMTNTSYSLSELASIPTGKTVSNVTSSSTSRASVSTYSGSYLITTTSTTGSATITITFTDGSKMYINLTISSTTSGTLSLTASASTVKEGNFATFTLENTANFSGTVYWSVTNPTGASVSLSKDSEYILGVKTATVNLEVNSVTTATTVTVTAQYGTTTRSVTINITP